MATISTCHGFNMLITDPSSLCMGDLSPVRKIFIERPAKQPYSFLTELLGVLTVMFTRKKRVKKRLLLLLS